MSLVGDRHCFFALLCDVSRNTDYLVTTAHGSQDMRMDVVLLLAYCFPVGDVRCVLQ